LQAWIDQLEGHLERAAALPLHRAIVGHSIAAAELDIAWLSNLADQLQSTVECSSEAQGLMTLSGDLEDYHLPDLIKLISSGQHTGTLTISDGPVLRSITFQGGRPHCAASRVGDRTVTDSERVLANIYELFGWPAGAYVFDQRGCASEGCVLLDLDTRSLMLGGARRLDSWEIIQRTVPSSSAVFEIRGDWRREGEPALIGEEQRVLDALDGSRDIATLSRLISLTEYETSRILYGLYMVDLVQPADPDKGRLRRVFREFAELMCRHALPFRSTPEEASACETEVNRRCQELPVRIENGRIVDETDVDLDAAELAAIYRTFLQTQHKVLGETLGVQVASELRLEVLGKLSPDLRETLEQYGILSAS
jgi:hypothetical protein